MATKKKVSRKTPSGPTTSLLVQMMNDMNSKLHQIHKDVQKNKTDIAKMQQEIAFGKGGVRALIWIAGIVSTIVGGITFWKS
jgi:glutamine synthetase adenylyltransferase